MSEETKEPKKSLFGQVSNVFMIIFILLAVYSIYWISRKVVPVFASGVGNINLNMDQIVYIDVNYQTEKVTVIYDGAFVFNGITKEEVYPLSKVYASKLVVIDETLIAPQRIDNVAYIPRHYDAR